MKGKNISNKDAFDLGLGGLLSGFGGMAYESEEQHNDRKIDNTEGKGWVVDTCYCPDTGCYETGISYDTINDGRWVIVEEYDAKEEAQKKHKKWVQHMKINPQKLFDIHQNEWKKAE